MAKEGVLPAQEQANDKPENKTRKISITGFSVMCTWHFLMIFTAVFNLSPWVSQGRAVWMQALLYVAMALTYLLLMQSSRFLIKALYRKGARRWEITNVAIAIAATVASVLTILSYGTPLAWQIFVYLFLGFAGAMLIFPWLELPQVKSDDTTNYRSLAINMGVGSIVAVIIGCLQSPINYVCICLLPLASVALLIVRWSGTEELDEETTSSMDTAERRKWGELIADNVHFIFYGFVFGFFQGGFADDMSITFVLNNSLPLLGATLSAIIIFCVPVKYLKSHGIFSIQRSSLFVLALGVIGAVYFHAPVAFDETISNAGTLISQILFFGGFNVFDFGFMIFSFSWAARLKTDFAAYIGANRALLYLGMAVGLAAGWGCSHYLGTMPGFYMLVGGLVIVVLIFTTMPFIDELVPYGSIDLSLEGVEDPSASDEADGAQEEQPKEEARAMRWKDRVSAIADEHGLSEREREVFFYLARGRNAAYIQQELWISIHTVKTHISNIYRKLNVHSMQEVLDMVDADQD